MKHIIQFSTMIYLPYLNLCLTNQLKMMKFILRDSVKKYHPSGNKMGGCMPLFQRTLPIKYHQDLDILQETVI